MSHKMDDGEYMVNQIRTIVSVNDPVCILTGAYFFRLVRSCVRLSVHPLRNLLRYSFEISYIVPHQKIIDTYFFKIWIIPLCGVMPLLKGHYEIL